MLDKLEALAKAATAGPWNNASTGEVRDSERRLVAHVLSTRGDFEDEAPNAAYIAAANPATVLKLVAAVRAAKIIDNHYAEGVTPDDVAIAVLRAALDELSGSNK